MTFYAAHRADVLQMHVLSNGRITSHLILRAFKAIVFGFAKLLPRANDV